MDINIRKIHPSENIKNIKVHNKGLPRDIRNCIANLIKHVVHVIQLEKSVSLKSGVQRAKAYFDYQKVLRELKNKYRIDASNKIAKRLSELRLGKLINKNISESDLVKLERLVTLPVKTLRDIASLRNINTNLPKSNIIHMH